MQSEAHRRKIEEAVVEILRTADLETLTEYDIRVMLAERLNIDFTDLEEKLLVRQFVESYLLSLPEQDKFVEQTKEVVQEQSPQLICNTSPETRQNSCTNICKLSSERSVSVKNFGGKTLVSFNDFYQKDGNQINTARGISLTANQWSAFKQGIPAIEEAILLMNSRKRKYEAEKKNEACISNKVSVLAPQGEVSIERKQTEVCNKVSLVAPQGEISTERKHTEAGDSTASTASAPEEHIPSGRQQKGTDPLDSVANITPNGQVKHNSVSAFPPQGIIPIQISRLNGRNYSCWMRQIYLILNQLKIAYVLSEPCPNVAMHEEASFEKTAQAKAAARKWIDDEYLCRVNILNSLSDHLYDQYSKRMLSSKELWEELKLSFDEDFGTKISQVSKYMQYQMVDGTSVLAQVQELHEIADTIIAYGMRIDENFHVSAIVSKLPPSWKEFRVKLMKEVCLPLSKLMFTLRVEEKSRMRQRPFKSSRHSKPENNFGSKTSDMKRLCYMCGNEGHISRNCGLRKLVECSNGNGNADVPMTTEGNKILK